MIRRESSAKRAGIVFHHTGTVTNLYKKILFLVVSEKHILSHGGSLRFPVEPQPAIAVMYDVFFNNGINCGMQLNSRHLRAGKLMPDIDVMNMIPDNI